MTEWRRLAATINLIIVFVFLSIASIYVKPAFPSNAGGSIDLFTQRAPFNGKGLNMPSDAFSPGDVVILYALVECDRYPQRNLMVTFYVRGPDNSSFSRTALTNASGIASINFTIPHKCPHENEIFGKWFSMASVLMNNNIFQDTLTFKVDWIVKLVSVKTIDNNLIQRDTFGITGDVGFEVALQNIAMTCKNVTLGIVVQDEVNHFVSSLEIVNLEIPPNEKTVFIYCKLNIPKETCVGKAKVLVSAFTALPSQNGVPYCPSISNEFFVAISEPLKLEFHDVAVVEVIPSATSVKIGDPVYIDVKVRNEGTELEKFNVSVEVDGQIVGTSYVLDLAPYSSKTLTFTFDTSSVNAGTYIITANIPKLPNEADVSDNILINGVIEVKEAIKQFLLTFDSEGLNTDAYGTVLVINGSSKSVNDLPYSCWVEEGSIITYSYETIVSSIVSGKRFKLDCITGPPSPLIVTNNMSITGIYKTQYYLSVSSPYGLPTPTSGWFDAGTTITAFVTSPWQGPPGTRYVCVGWVGSGSVPPSGTSPTVTFIIDQPSMITWNWKTQYYLSVATSPIGIAVITGEGWYDAYVNVSLHAPLVAGYDFSHWDVDGVSRPVGVYQIVVFMDGPHTATAHYSARRAEWLYLILLVILILLIVLLCVLAYRRIRRRRKDGDEAFRRGWTAWYYGYNLKGKSHGFESYVFEKKS
ncbi:MAG: CARDB domain-containing protein [Candidatus Bathyarchaeia archaeon]